MRIEEALGGVVVGINDDGRGLEFLSFVGNGIGLRERRNGHDGSSPETDRQNNECATHEFPPGCKMSLGRVADEDEQRPAIGKQESSNWI
jgi:hypothetical protein